MEDRKKRNSTNDNINLQSDILIDLPLADEQADETKGGGETKDSRDFSGQIQVLSWSWGVTQTGSF